MRPKPTKLLRVRLDFTVELAREVDSLPKLTLGVLDGAAMAVHKHLPDDLRAYPKRSRSWAARGSSSLSTTGSSTSCEG